MGRNVDMEDISGKSSHTFALHSEPTKRISSREFGIRQLNIFSKADFSKKLEYLTFLSIIIKLKLDETLTCVGCTLQIKKSIAIKNEPDNFLIKKEIRIATTINYCTVLLWAFLVGIDPGDFSKNEKIQSTIILMIGFLISFLYMTLYQAFVVAKTQEDEVYGSIYGSSLDDVLQNETGRKLFVAHLVEELSLENYLFYSAITSWKEEYRKLNFECHENFYQQMLNSFILPGSPLEINISYVQRQATIEKITLKKYYVDDFDEAYSEVEKLLTQDSLPRFKLSARYQNWVKNDNIGRISAFL
eukprot:snap_masked-scaffold_14-processed-gene-4.34-mRNA-1 protein AED:1.00 eAED:1.00 QI:0/0/0/0/1/1/3/0/301